MPRPLKLNPIFNKTDSYKHTHWFQLPPDTEYVYSYLMSRGGFWKHTQFFGLQYILAANWEGQVFNKADVEEAYELSKLHFGNDKVFNLKGWMSLLKKHRGRFPLRIRAVPEGMLIPIKHPLMTIQNTDPEFPWLTNWAETILLQVWYPITVGTLSFEIKQAIGADLVRTGDPALLPFKLHDFGYRGVSSVESAAIGGAAHLVNFLGTDTTAALGLLKQYYSSPMAGYSIAAMEHSTVCSWGELFECEAYQNMLDKAPDGLIACVIDSYEMRNAVAEYFGNRLRDQILRRNGAVVLRPDSGDPCVELEDLFNIVSDRFGSEANQKGWKVLNPQVRAIQGDGVNYQNILRINSSLTRKGWSMDNWGYGMGGALLQQQNRDTQRFSIKCSAVKRSGEWYDVYKTTKADPSKASIAGRFELVYFEEDNDFKTIQEDDLGPQGYGGGKQLLQTVFEDGKITKTYDLEQVRKNAAAFDRFNKEEEE